MFFLKLSNSSNVDDELLLPSPMYLFSAGTTGGKISKFDPPTLLAPPATAPAPRFCWCWFDPLYAVGFMEEEYDVLERIDDDGGGGWRKDEDVGGDGLRL